MFRVPSEDVRERQEVPHGLQCSPRETTEAREQAERMGSLREPRVNAAVIGHERQRDQAMLCRR